MTLYVDVTTLATLQEDGSICCDNCGSWTNLDDMAIDGSCPLCREDAKGQVAAS
jgi:hypothetical protein